MRLNHLLSFALTLIALPLAAQTPESESPSAESTPTPQAVVIRPTQPERSSQMAQALIERLPASEQAELSTPTESFLGLWHLAHHAQVTRAVILLPGADQHADQPGVIQPLRQELPKHGWHTLSLMLPDPYDPLPKRQAIQVLVQSEPEQQPDESIASAQVAEEAAPAPIEQLQEEDAEAQEPAKPIQATAPDNRDRYAERLFDRIDAALAFVKSHGVEEVVLLGHGTGAYWSARYTENRTPKDVSRLIWVDGIEAQAMSPSLVALLTELNLPIADISLFAADPLRKAQALRLNYQGYRAIGLTPLVDGTANQLQLVRRVRGWLDPKP